MWCVVDQISQKRVEETKGGIIVQGLTYATSREVSRRDLQHLSFYVWVWLRDSFDINFRFYRLISTAIRHTIGRTSQPWICDMNRSDVECNDPFVLACRADDLCPHPIHPPTQVVMPTRWLRTTTSPINLKEVQIINTIGMPIGLSMLVWVVSLKSIKCSFINTSPKWHLPLVVNKPRGCVYYLRWEYNLYF